MGQPNSQLCQARENPGITSIQVGVPHQARVKNIGQSLGQRVAYGEPATTKRHVKRVLRVLIIALGVTPHVEPPVRIVLGQGPHQIVHDEHSVIVAEHEPTHIRLAEGDDLLDDTSHADRRPEASTESVREPGGVAGDDDRRDGAIAGLRNRLVEEHEAAGSFRGVPEADEGLAASPGGRGGGNGEDEVAARGRKRVTQ